MTINEVMGLIMPSIIALLFYSHISKKSPTVFEGIGLFSMLMLTTNCLGYAVMIYLKKSPYFDFSTIFTVKYSLMAVCISFVVVLIYRFLELHLNIRLRVETLDEEEKK